MNNIVNNTFLNNIETEKIDKILETTNDNSQYFESISTGVVTAYTEDLDSIMQEIYVNVISADGCSDDMLENYCLRLSSILYFMGDKLESVGIKDDLSEAARAEVYNQAYLKNQIKDPTDKSKKITVAELQSLATEASKYESVINSIYSRCYKQIKYKIDAGYRYVDVLRKIISKRMNDSQLSMYTPKNKILNEGAQ